MSELMNFADMERSYDGQWVLIAYTKTDDNLQVIEGRVIAHSVDKNDIYRALKAVPEQPLAIEYMGSMPEDLAFIL